MSYQVYASTNGILLNLSDLVDLKLLMMDAFGLPPFNNQMEQGPLQHGATWLDYRLEPRQITLNLTQYASDLANQYALRSIMLNQFRPGVKVNLKVSIDSGATWKQIDAYVNGGLNYGWMDLVGPNNIRATISLVAPDPTWYDPSGDFVGFWMGDSSGFTVPFEIPTTMLATGTVIYHSMVNYPGTWPSFPIMTITGPIHDAIITNDTTGKKLDFTGYDLTTGHYITVDLRYGYKTVKLDGATNLIDKLTTDSDLSTWSIEGISTGEMTHANGITVSGHGCTGNTRIDLAYFVRYLGI